MQAWAQELENVQVESTNVKMCLKNNCACAYGLCGILPLSFAQNDQNN